ncbi:hypothetical protein HBI56_069870 [Parastagonospora nodorum]|uniref:Uncharacterized protein n=2 Tax=Phaeosphaeria nodorum (strain SN15 / ATCC MYA-4574 / FGSC 10173) TaxID=321614 RepID=A0A7U2ESI9_PHANO|nr:hypothetical protein SNOG_09735 [Parastagonospora nodorum SN15]KAH3920425.1 hypothetical protein HBH56_004310 [Parastagonospora nodorum]EAT83000.1 hypothetical protein SNOG_09735 [Parastagonospora nodorum SN15]KAH3937691.1 hypothetical protein HBH54_004300 [Parastagonospora nodorum]KAH3946528.1 hypothetical protein HBH53_127670 [Parastagonospora nodorum]KAH3975154.1 hypothetical protein HBH51_087060 [Parastagonospora nodorum]
MKSFTAVAAVLFASAVSAQYNATTPTPTAAISTIKITPACPSAPAADVQVTRSGVVVPTCEAGSGSNATKPTIMTMPGYGMKPSGNATASGPPAQFTGAAEGLRIGGVAVVLGGLAALVL